MKKIIIIVLSFLLILSASMTFAEESKNDINVKVNGKTVYFPDQKPLLQLETSRTIVPVRFIAEELGAKVDWDNDTKTVFINMPEKEIQMQIDNHQVLINNEKQIQDQAATLIGSRTYVPVRFVSETLGCTVGWDNDTHTVLITTKADKKVMKTFSYDQAHFKYDEKHQEIIDLVNMIIEYENEDVSEGYADVYYGEDRDVIAADKGESKALCDRNMIRFVENADYMFRGFFDKSKANYYDPKGYRYGLFISYGREKTFCDELAKVIFEDEYVKYEQICQKAKATEPPIDGKFVILFDGKINKRPVIVMHSRISLDFEIGDKE